MRGIIPDGDKVRGARITRGLTQEQLAVQADVDVKTVRKAEHGRRLDVSTLADLARALAVPMQSLMLDETDVSELERARLAAVEQWIVAWDAQNSDVLMSLYCDDAVMILPGGSGSPFGGRHEGKDAIRRCNESAWKSVNTEPMRRGDYAVYLHGETVIVEGVKTVCRPDGSPLRLAGVHIYEFSGTLISEMRVQYDTLAIHGILDHNAAG